ncbi:hypothetical protein ACFLSJ_07680 [Verrucomicrobiota bacterium]
MDIGNRLELFVDRHLIEEMEGVGLHMHEPRQLPLPRDPLPVSYSTVIREGDLYRAYYRDYRPGYEGGRGDGNQGELYCHAESRDGHEWSFPDLGVVDVKGSNGGNVIMAEAPYCHNLSPFPDTRPGVEEERRFKALAGTHPGGLHAFSSGDGIHWARMQEGPVITSADFAFDSQNVSFWSTAEECYVCCFRSWTTPHGRLRTISRCTSEDFIHWTGPVPTNPNLPGEHLYTSNTHPYFRAPHIYVALPTRFMPDRGESTDILFMATRAGSRTYERLFTEAFIRPGLDRVRWGNRSNYVAQNVVPTGEAEMSIYHRDGHRYVLRTDGFVSVRAGFAQGRLLTKPFTFAGRELTVNYSTSAAGSMQVELRDGAGSPVPGFRLEECPLIVGDAIGQQVRWKGAPELAALAGKQVRLCFAMKECDLYSFRFLP